MEIPVYYSILRKCAENNFWAGWWFGTFFIFPYIGNNHPNWLIFFRGVQTTNQWVIPLLSTLLETFFVFSHWMKYTDLASQRPRIDDASDGGKHPQPKSSSGGGSSRPKEALFQLFSGWITLSIYKSANTYGHYCFYYPFQVAGCYQNRWLLQIPNDSWSAGRISCSVPAFPRGVLNCRATGLILDGWKLSICTWNSGLSRNSET